MEKELDREFYVYEESGVTKVSVIDYISGVIVAIPINDPDSSLGEIKAITKVNQILSNILSDLKEKEQ